jgi:hypothetical protein
MDTAIDLKLEPGMAASVDVSGHGCLLDSQPATGAPAQGVLRLNWRELLFGEARG